MKKIIKFMLCIILMFGSIIFIYYHYKNTEVNDMDNEVLSDATEDVISPLIDQYNNDEIIAKLVIPGILDTPVVQYVDNDYYINHDIYKDINDQGAIYLDYRNKLNDNKLIIYGHNNSSKTLIFKDLLNYKDEDFYLKHNSIYLYTKNDVNRYKIFSVFETNDLSYTNLRSFNGYSYYEHLKEMKESSIFENDTEITGNSKILVLDTDILNNDTISHFLVIGVLE